MFVPDQALFTVQQIFNSLNSAPNMTLALTDRGAYANVYGVYTIQSSNEPELASILNISLPGLPYSCLTTSTYLYIAQWNDTIFIIDGCRVTEYTLTGIYKGNWTYLYGYQSAVRNFIQHDYGGRIYTCNSIGTNPGIYAFLQNGTKIGNGPVNCLRAFQFYLTKDQAILINISPIGSLMQIINF